MPSLTALPLLDVAIGLVLLFFLLSTLCSVFNEMLASFFGWRSKTLEDAIRNMLGDPAIKNDARAWFGRLAKSAKGVSSPHRDMTAEVFEHWRITSLVRKPESNFRRRSRPSYLPPRALSLAIAETLAEGPASPPDGRSAWQLTDDELLARIEAALSGVPEGPARELLHKSVVNAHHTLEGFRLQVEAGFDDAMERASGWYKRKVQAVLLLFAILVTVG